MVKYANTELLCKECLMVLDVKCLILCREDCFFSLGPNKEETFATKGMK